MIVKFTQPGADGKSVWVAVEHVTTVNHCKEHGGARIGLLNGTTFSVREQPEEVVRDLITMRLKP